MSKSAFWQALIFTAIIFSLGVIAGFFLESRQSETIYSRLVNSELNIIDEQLRQRIISDSNLSCSLSKESLFLFADKIYEEAMGLEEIDTTGRLGDLTILHRRYDLLRTLLLLEAESLKERCNGDFHIISYFYSYNLDDVETSSKQNYFSKQTFDLKTAHPQDIILIPIAIDTNVASIDVFIKSRKITTYPVILIDNNKEISEFVTLEELEKLVFNDTISSP
ncbi:hypothetical protein J4416_00360 [Candidatus Pacearchaeota archaeon]|nr:hypothetical protein [Candidatus Pacearchaeota archaeon]